MVQRRRYANRPCTGYAEPVRVWVYSCRWILSQLNPDFTPDLSQLNPDSPGTCLNFTRPLGGTILPTSIYAKEKIYLCRDVQAIRLYKKSSDAETTQPAAETQPALYNDAGFKVKGSDYSLSAVGKNSDYVLIGTSLDMHEQAAMLDRLHTQKILEDNKRPTKADHLEFQFKQGEYRGRCGVIRRLDDAMCSSSKAAKLLGESWQTLATKSEQCLEQAGRGTAIARIFPEKSSSEILSVNYFWFTYEISIF